MNRYRTVIIPAYGDITALVRVLIVKAYNAGYADCEDKHQQKVEFLKAVDTSGLTGCRAWGRIVKDMESVAKQAYKAGGNK